MKFFSEFIFNSLRIFWNAFWSICAQNRRKTKILGRILVIHSDIVINFLRILSTKSTISQKIKITKMGKLFFHRFQNIVHLLGQFFLLPFLVIYFGEILWILVQINHNPKKKNRKYRKKCFFSQVSEHCVSFWIRNQIWTL